MSAVAAERALSVNLIATVSAIGIADLVLPLIQSPWGPWQELYWGFFLAQVSLHAALVVLVRGFVPMRIISVAALALLFVWYHQAIYPSVESSLFSQLQMWSWILTAVASWGLSLLGFRLYRLSATDEREFVHATGPQFSLRSMVVAMTAACVLVGMAMRAKHDGPSDFDGALAMVIGAMLAGVQICLVLTVLVPKRPWIPMGVAVGLGYLLILVVLGRLAHSDALLFIVPTGLQLLALAGLRRLGYRLWRLEARPRPAMMPVGDQATPWHQAAPDDGTPE